MPKLTIEGLKKIKEKGLRIRGIPGSPPDPAEPLTGCPFSERCEYVQDLCKEKMPEYREVVKDYWILCHRYEELAEW